MSKNLKKRKEERKNKIWKEKRNEEIRSI